MKPLVSIIIPVYNGSNYLAQAIDSALAQTYTPIEIIVVNDGSRDDGATEEVALGYGDRITYVRKENGGSSSALNEGIRHMNGAYFSWLSHDDLYEPTKIEVEMEEMLQRGSDRHMVVCGSSLIDQNGNALMGRKRKTLGEKTALEALRLLSHANGINGCAVLIPKAVLDRVGFFDEDMVYLNDMDYWYRILLADTAILYMRDPLVKTRIHGQQVSVTKRQLFDGERHYLANKLLDEIEGAEVDPRSAMKQVAYFCASENLGAEYRKAIAILKRNRWSSAGLRVYLWGCWLVGWGRRCLKGLRKMIQFHR